MTGGTHNEGYTTFKISKPIYMELAAFLIRLFNHRGRRRPILVTEAIVPKGASRCGFHIPHKFQAGKNDLRACSAMVSVVSLVTLAVVN
jgi:hypothetical protein